MRRHRDAAVRSGAALAGIALALVLIGCARGSAVVLHTVDGAAVRVRVEVMNTAPGRAQGMMYRRDLAADGGMLFVFPRDAAQRFWMKNTLIPLDMLFIDRDRRVIGIVANAKPLSEQPVGPDQPVRYVLEVNGGFATQQRITAGATVEFIGVPDTAS